jgi:hypothetical protein
MVDMWAGYMWGENSNYTVSWDQPRTIVADSSIFILTATDLPRVTAWIRSVTVKDPSTGSISVKASPAAVSVRIEENAIAVTFALNSVNCSDAEALIHIYYWS